MSLLSRIREALPVSRRDMLALQAENESLERRVRASKAVASGVEINFGRFDYEDNEFLNGAAKWTTLDRMEADPAVKGALMARALPLQNAEWDIQAASDDPRDQEIADFVSANLLRKQTEQFGRQFWTETPWESQRLPEILQSDRDGFSLFHLTTRPVGTKRVFDRIQWIEPHTIDAMEPWVIDDEDRIVQINRTFTVPSGLVETEAPLLAGEIALYVHGMKGARYEGRPFVRSMYGAWFRKEAVQRWRAIWAQKTGSPAPLGIYPKSWDAAAREDFSRYLKAIRGTAPAETYGMFPVMPGEDPPTITWAGAEHDVERGMNDLVDSENAEISRAGSTKSRLLGETQSGSRSLGDSQLGMEMLEIQSLAKAICSMESHGVANIPGLIQRLVDMNYPNVEAYPVLTCSKIDPDENLKHLDGLVKAVQAGIVPNHPDLRKSVTGMFGIVLPDDAFEEMDVAPEVPTDPADSPPPNPGAASDPDDDDEVQAAALTTKQEIAERLGPLLEPVREGSPRTGGRFPDQAGGQGTQPRRDPGDVPRRRA